VGGGEGGGAGRGLPFLLLWCVRVWGEVGVPARCVIYCMRCWLLVIMSGPGFD